MLDLHRTALINCKLCLVGLEASSAGIAFAVKYCICSKVCEGWEMTRELAVRTQ